jgi:hypothetical protein
LSASGSRAGSLSDESAGKHSVEFAEERRSGIDGEGRVVTSLLRCEDLSMLGFATDLGEKGDD